MEFDVNHWRTAPASRWLVKLADDHVHAGVITLFTDTTVEVDSVDGIVRLDALQVEWIRPLIVIGADGWTVMIGFQADDRTFDTWWKQGEVLLSINFSAPSGFSNLLHPITPNGNLDAARTPSLGTLALVHAQVSHALIERQHQAVPPVAHLQ